jgi:hypothetical protein
LSFIQGLQEDGMLVSVKTRLQMGAAGAAGSLALTGTSNNDDIFAGSIAGSARR